MYVLFWNDSDEITLVNSFDFSNESFIKAWVHQMGIKCAQHEETDDVFT